MSESDAESIVVLQSARVAGYLAVAGTTIFIYDSLLVFDREISEHIYWGPKPRSTTTTIYLSIKVLGILYFAALLYSSISPNTTRPGCLVSEWVTGLVVDVIYTATMKSLVVLRIRALYANGLKIRIALFSMLIIEISCGILVFVTYISIEHRYQPTPRTTSGPLSSGCYKNYPDSSLRALYAKALLVFWTMRLITTDIELILLAIKLYQAVKDQKMSSWLAITQMRRLTPVLYVFYRDGMLMRVGPIFAINCLGCISSARPESSLSKINWGMWLLLQYHFCGTRLILNIRRANSKLTGTLITQRLSALQFDTFATAERELYMDEHLPPS